MKQVLHYREYLGLCKPRVVGLIVFTAMIGMALAPSAGFQRWFFASLGIALAAAGAAACNCLLERRIDAVMARTCSRALPQGRVTFTEALILALVLAVVGLGLLVHQVNLLSALLTGATFIGYALIYTLLLKPATPQNIVIGGLAGAMPPLLGWVAMTGEITHQALLLVLIIFAWTPPHFWSLALYRREDYARAGLPMLPVTHGDDYTRLHILLYSVLLAAVTALPVAVGMSGPLYGMAALVLNGLFLRQVWALYQEASTTQAHRTFAWSIRYLGLLFTALLLDHGVFS